MMSAKCYEALHGMVMDRCAAPTMAQRPRLSYYDLSGLKEEVAEVEPENSRNPNPQIRTRRYQDIRTEFINDGPMGQYVRCAPAWPSFDGCSFLASHPLSPKAALIASARRIREYIFRRCRDSDEYQAQVRAAPNTSKHHTVPQGI
jgi:hypothetical protein